MGASEKISPTYLLLKKNGKKGITSYFCLNVTTPYSLFFGEGVSPQQESLKKEPKKGKKQQPPHSTRYSSMLPRPPRRPRRRGAALLPPAAPIRASPRQGAGPSREGCSPSQLRRRRASLAEGPEPRRSRRSRWAPASPPLHPGMAVRFPTASRAGGGRGPAAGGAASGGRRQTRWRPAAMMGLREGGGGGGRRYPPHSAASRSFSPGTFVGRSECLYPHVGLTRLIHV